MGSWMGVEAGVLKGKTGEGMGKKGRERNERGVRIVGRGWRGRVRDGNIWKNGVPLHFPPFLNFSIYIFKSFVQFEISLWRLFEDLTPRTVVIRLLTGHQKLLLGLLLDIEWTYFVLWASAELLIRICEIHLRVTYWPNGSSLVKTPWHCKISCHGEFTC